MASEPTANEVLARPSTDPDTSERPAPACVHLPITSVLVGLGSPADNRALCAEGKAQPAASEPHFEWQVKQTALPALLTRRKVALKTLPGPAEGTPCGSWQEAHSTS